MPAVQGRQGLFKLHKFHIAAAAREAHKTHVLAKHRETASNYSVKIHPNNYRWFLRIPSLLLFLTL